MQPEEGLTKIDRFAMDIFASTIKMSESITSRTKLIKLLEESRESEFEKYFSWQKSNVGKNIRTSMPEGLREYNPLTEEGCKEIAHYRVDIETLRTRGALDAAAIVFAHSIFEELVFTLFEIDYRENPSSWDAELGKQKILLDSALSMTKDEMREECWNAILLDMRHKPLFKNLGRLIARCKDADPIMQKRILESHRLDIQRICVVDRLRQDLIHRPKPAAVILETDDVLNYLVDMTELVTELAAKCLMKIDLKLMGLNNMQGNLIGM